MPASAAIRWSCWPGRNRGHVAGLAQMGAEGAQWIGAAPFVEVPHFVQNLGDGTFHHSGSLAVRAAVAAGLNVTYKLLVNGYVAMTGGQRVAGQMSVPALACSLEAEGVRRIVITTENPAGYARVALPAIAEVRDRTEMLEIQRELARVKASPCCCTTRPAQLSCGGSASAAAHPSHRDVC